MLSGRLPTLKLDFKNNVLFTRSNNQFRNYESLIFTTFLTHQIENWLLDLVSKIQLSLFYFFKIVTLLNHKHMSRTQNISKNQKQLYLSLELKRTFQYLYRNIFSNKVSQKRRPCWLTSFFNIYHRKFFNFLWLTWDHYLP